MGGMITQALWCRAMRPSTLLFLVFTTACGASSGGHSTPSDGGEEGSVDHVEGGTLPGDGESTALAVNSTGWVVGRSTTSGRMSSRAFFWTEGTGMLDLASLVENAPGDLRLNAAHDINDSGQIVCDGLANGIGRGFLLEPIYHVEMGRPVFR